MPLSLLQRINNNTDDINTLKSISVDSKEDTIVPALPDLNNDGKLKPSIFKMNGLTYIKGVMRSHLHLEAENITINSFPWASGFGTPSNLRFGHYLGTSAYLVRYHYNFCKVDAVNGDPDNSVSEPGNISFQMYQNGIAKNVFIRITIADLSTTQYVSSQFTDENENPITSVLQHVNQNWVNQPIAFKCIGVSNLNGVNTRHRLTIEYEDYIY